MIDGVMDRKGHTRSQIDAQRIYNYWASAAVEQVALQTKTPYVGSVRALQGREEQVDLPPTPRTGAFWSITTSTFGREAD